MAGKKDEFSEDIREDRFVGGLESAPGFPSDDAAIPEVLYQVLEGKVYLLQSWKDGSSLRGELKLEDLENLVGSPPKAGWYDAAGKYLGSAAPTASWLDG